MHTYVCMYVCAQYILHIMYVRHTASRATACLNRLRRIMYSSSPIAKAIAFKCLVRPHLEYACQVWSLYANKNIDLLETVQRRASRWIYSKWDPLVLK